MFLTRVLPRITRSSSLTHYRGFVSAREQLRQILPHNSDSQSATRKWVPCQVTASRNLLATSTSQHLWYSSSATPEPNEKEGNQTGEEQEAVPDNASAKAEVKTNGDDKASEDAENSGSPSLSTSKSVRKRRGGTKRTAFSDSDSESDLTFDDLTKLLAEKEELLKTKNKEMEKMQDKVLRTYAEMENVMDRTRREAENSKKFAIQSFAKGLLDVADNLGRASSVVKESFSKIDSSKDSAGAVPLLKTLLEGVEMTDKQLSEVFRKFGVEKFDPLNEQFDPNRHHALFQIPDGSKPAGTIAAVLKPGYLLYDRIIRPAEVGVTEAPSNETDESS